jgi:hypothetical protein
MAVDVHRYQRITLPGKLRQMSAGDPAGKNIIEERGDPFCPAILVADNNSATIAAVEHASAICAGLRDGVFAFGLKVLLRNIPACPGPHHCGGNSRRIRELSGFWPHARPVRARSIFGCIPMSRQ